MTADGVVFGARLCAYRRSAGLSQAELAEQSGLSVRAVSNLERGRTRCPHPETVHQLADALGLRAEVRAAFAAAAGRRLAGTAAGSVITTGGIDCPGPVKSVWCRGSCRVRCGSSPAARMSWRR
jgi:DNA-binding XRE family transcriptional regulator